MASPNISFNSIPASTRKPGVYAEFNNTLAVQSLPTNQQRLLIFAQQTGAATVPAGVAVGCSSDAQAAALFGPGSMAHLMVLAALTANQYANITVMPLADAAGSTAAHATITFVGAPTGAGTVTFLWNTAGRMDRQVSVAVTATESVSTIMAALVAAINLQANWPFTAATSGAATITLTAKNAGTVMNKLTFSTVETVPGMTVTSSAQFAGGATDPDLTGALTNLFPSTYEMLVSPYTTQVQIAAIRDFLNARSNAIEKRGGYLIYGITDSMPTGTTLAELINGERCVCALLPFTPSLPFEVAAAFASVAAFQEDPSASLNTLQLVGIEPPPQPQQLVRIDQETALHNGCAPIEVGPGQLCQIVRAVTTYVVNPANIPDISWLDFSSIRSMDYVRKAAVTRIALRFPRAKNSTRTAPKVRSELYAMLLQLQDLEIVENVEANKDGLLVEQDLQNPDWLDAKIPTNIVPNLNVVAMQLDLIL